ncbi:MAG: MATE family efflux transporter [Muribaculaceae bacterium]
MKVLNREILLLAVPAIVSNITTPVLSIVDTAIVGHIGSAVYIGAIAVGGSMLNLVYWLMNFLRMGSSGLTAQAYGAGHIDECYAVVRRALVTGAVCALALWLLALPLCRALLFFMDADSHTSALAARYFYIVVSGAPAVMGNYALSGWFLGMQDSRTPMWMALITNIVNIAVSLTLVVGFGMKIEGVAIGTASAQWAGLIYGLARLLRRYKSDRPGAVNTLGNNALRRFFAINTDIFLRTACLVSVTLWFTRTGARQGVDTLAANALLMQFFLFFSYFMDGFAFAAEALSGKYRGAANTAGLRRCIRAIFGWGASLSAAFAVIYLLGGRGAISLLTDRPEVVATAGGYVLWSAMVPVAGFAAFVWDGIYTGLTLTRRMALAMAVAAIVFFAASYSLVPVMGNHGLWAAFLCFLLSRGAMQTYMFSRLKPYTTD